MGLHLFSKLYGSDFEVLVQVMKEQWIYNVMLDILDFIAARSASLPLLSAFYAHFGPFLLDLLAKAISTFRTPTKYPYLF